MRKSVVKISALLIAILISGAASYHVLAKADYKKIGIEINGKKLDVAAYVVDNRTMVPMRAIFETLQSDVKWDQSSQSVTAKKGSTTVKLKIDSPTAQVNGKTLKLDVPPMLIKGLTVVPLRFVSESLGAEVGVDAKRNVVSVRTKDSGPQPGPAASPVPNPAPSSEPSPAASPAPSPAPSSEPGPAASPAPSKGPSSEAEPFVVKGRVTDKQGKPIEGVEITADNQLARDSYQTAYTDDNGYYQIDLPPLNTTWNMFSYYEHKFEGKVHAFNLTSVTDRPFGANKGAVRDFVWDNYDAMVIIDIYDYPQNEDWPEFSLDDVELTLTPVSPLIDGSEGSAITEMSVFSPYGAGLQSVPIAKYEVTARWVPDGIPPVPMLVSEYAANDYKESIVTSDFEDIVGTKKRVAIKVKVVEAG